MLMQGQKIKAGINAASRDAVSILHADTILPNFEIDRMVEDVELSIHLNRLGKQAYLYGNAMVPARRWGEKDSKNAVLIICLAILYLVKRMREHRIHPNVTGFIIL